LYFAATMYMSGKVIRMKVHRIEKSVSIWGKTLRNLHLSISPILHPILTVIKILFNPNLQKYFLLLHF
jgi:hypothetical protein